MSDRELAIARAVDAVADDSSASSSQVALAWTRARRNWIHPILGARTAEQLTDSLGAFDLTLPSEAVDRLDQAAAFDLGFPQDFIAMSREFVYGPAGAALDARTPAPGLPAI